MIHDPIPALTAGLHNLVSLSLLACYAWVKKGYTVDFHSESDWYNIWIGPFKCVVDCGVVTNHKITHTGPLPG